jgi:diguanylate cyclase (GGDEF)-like protein
MSLSVPIPPTTSRRWPSVTQVEPVLPAVLGVHGLVMHALLPGPGWPAVVFLAVTALGAAGIAGWTSSFARGVRAVACLLVPLVLSLGEPGLISSLLQWYYCAAAIYSLVVAHRAALLIGPLAGLCYLLQVTAGAGSVPWAVALLRAGVLCALGLSSWLAGTAYRTSAAAAAEGRSAAEAARHELQHAATHDELTGLPNRALLHARLADALAEAPETSLLLLDLDHFKEVNDTLGHRYGDELLDQVGTRLASLMRARDTVARLGGDEFAILLPATDTAAATRIAARLREALQEPFTVHEAMIAVDASIGIASAPEHADTGDGLLQRADVAMYAAKRSGSDSTVYEPSADRHGADRLALLAELRHAIADGELVVEYQPKVLARTGEVAGMEALVRWEHPTRGRIDPDVFIPLAERSGLIRPLTALVLDTALSQCRRWRDAGLWLTVSVNLSARDLQQEDLPQHVSFALHRHRLPATALELEITESFLMSDPQRARALLTQLSELGITLAIDDFGTGMASLSYLKNLPVQVLKIDKSFVTHMTADATDNLIVAGVVALSSSLGLTTIAEGVEDTRTLRRLAEVGCTQAQGYGISRPMPAGEVIGWVTERRRRAAASVG